MKQISLALSLSLIVVGFIVGIGVGYYVTPQYQETMYERGMDLGRADRLVDLRYLNAMAAHHRGAMLLAEQAQQSQRQEIASLAADILKNEPALIQELYQWKEDWYGDSRGVRDPQVANLGEVDATFDLRFLNALIAHHQAGIEMTKEIRTKSSRSEVINNADAVEQFLTSTLPMLRDWRRVWYSVQ